MSYTKQSQAFKSKRQEYVSLLTTRAKTLKAARDATRHVLRAEGLYDECKYLFCAGDSAFADDPHPKQQCSSIAFLRMVKEVRPSLLSKTMSPHSNSYLVSFMWYDTEFFAIVSREELKREGMIKYVGRL